MTAKFKFILKCPIEGCGWKVEGNPDKDVEIMMAWNDFEIHLRQVHDWKHSEIVALINDTPRLEKLVVMERGE